MKINKDYIDPTYLRTINDGLNSGAIHKNNASALPLGLVGMYEAAFPPTSNVNDRKKALDFFAIWSLLRREVSAAFVLPLLEGWTEEQLLEYIARYSKWFNSPVSSKYQLYHERFRAFILQKISHQQFSTFNNLIINQCQRALLEKNGNEWELYALECLSTHLLIKAMENGDGSALKSLAYNTTHWNRQIEISKGFDWSKRMLNDMMPWASKYNEEEVIECALNKVDLYHLEQNDAPRIVELVAQNDIETALNRIEAFGGNDKEGLQRKCILYMLCFMELTLLESKEKPFRKKAIEKLLKHFDDNIPVDYSVLNWNDFFPSYLVFQMACEWAEMGLDYLIIYKSTSVWENDWIEEKGPYSDYQFKILIKFLKFKKELNWNFDANEKILNELLKQGKIEVALELVKNITDIDKKNETIIKISRLLISKNNIENSYKLIDDLIKKNTNTIPNAQNELVEEFILNNDFVNANQLINKITHKFYKVCAICSLNSKYILLGKNTKADSALKFAIELSNKIQNNSWKLMSIRKIAIEYIKQSKFKEANKFIKESFKLKDVSDKSFIKYFGLSQICIAYADKLKLNHALNIAQKINDVTLKDNALFNISIHFVEKGNFKNARRCANYISNDGDKSWALRDISVGLAKHGKFNEALKCANIICDQSYNAYAKIVEEMLIQGKVKKVLFFTQSIINVSEKCIILQLIISHLAKIRKFDEANKVFLLLCNISRGDARINHQFQQFIALSNISIELSKIGNENKSSEMMQEALKYARCIADFDNKNTAFKRIYYSLAENGMINNLAKLMQESIKYVQIKSNEYDDYAIVKEISIELTKLENINMAIKCARSINDESEKISALLNIQNELNKCDNIENTLSVIDEAIECVRGVMDYKNKITLILEIANELTKHNKIEDSISLINDAIECTHFLIDKVDKSLALAKISSALAIKGKFEDAGLIMNQACEFAQKILDKTKMASTLIDISIELVKQGKIPNAIECANSISDNYWKNEAFKCISIKLANQGMFLNALELARSINDNSDMSRALSVISTILAQQGKTEYSSFVIKEALEAANDINDDDFFKDEVLYDITCELIKQGKLGEAFKCVENITEDLFQSFSLCAISKKLAEQNNWTFAEEIALEIKQSKERRNCLRSLAGIKLTETSCQKRLEQSVLFQNTEAKKYYLKGFADFITASECSSEFILSSRGYYFDDLNSIEKLLQMHALHELFYQELSKEKTERFNRTLNIQWAIDIKNSIRNN